jgi:hypothetical protein
VAAAGGENCVDDLGLLRRALSMRGLTALDKLRIQFIFRAQS